MNILLMKMIPLHMQVKTIIWFMLITFRIEEQLQRGYSESQLSLSKWKHWSVEIVTIFVIWSVEEYQHLPPPHQILLGKWKVAASSDWAFISMVFPLIRHNQAAHLRKSVNLLTERNSFSLWAFSDLFVSVWSIWTETYPQARLSCFDDSFLSHGVWVTFN